MQKIIHQILITDSGKLPNVLPEYYTKCKNSITRYFPDWEYKLYSGNEIEELIKNDKVIYNTYNSFKGFAIKADIARYYLLYLYGGLYIDITTEFFKTLNITQDYDFYGFNTSIEWCKRSWHVHNGLMYTARNSKVMKLALYYCTKHAKERYYGDTCLSPTGPFVLGNAIQNLCYDTSANICIDGYLKWTTLNNNLTAPAFYKFNADSEYFALFKHYNYIVHDAVPTLSELGFTGTNSYVDLWYNRDFYNDVNWDN